MRFLLQLSLVLLCVGCFQQSERQCKNFKYGTFEYKAFINGEVQTTRFERKDSIEIDYFQEKIDTSSVRWINDCEYIVKKLNPKNMAEEKAVHIKIISSNDNSYTFEFSIVGNSAKQRGTATKVD